MAQYTEYVDVVAKVKTTADTTGLSDDIKEVLEKPFQITLEADMKKALQDVKADIKKISKALDGSIDLSKAFEGIDFSKMTKSIEEAINSIDTSGLAENLKQAFKEGTNGGFETIEEKLLRLKKESSGDYQGQKIRSTTQNYANDVYGKLIEQAKQLENAQDIIKKLKDHKPTDTKTKGWNLGMSNYENWAKELSDALNGTALKEAATKLLDDAKANLQPQLEQLKTMRAEAEKLRDALSEIYYDLPDNQLTKGKHAQEEKATSVTKKVSNTNIDWLSDDILDKSKGSEFLDVPGVLHVRKALLALYNTVVQLQGAFREAKGSTKDKTLWSIDVAGIKEIRDVLGEFGKDKGQVESKYKNLAELFNHMVEQVDKLVESLQRLTEQQTKPVSYHETQLLQLQNELQNQERTIQEANEQLKKTWSERVEIFEDLASAQNAFQGTVNDEGRKSNSTYYKAIKAMMKAQGDLLPGQTLQKYEGTEENQLTKQEVRHNNYFDIARDFLAQYLQLQGNIEELGISKLADSQILKIAQQTLDEYQTKIDSLNKKREEILINVKQSERDLELAKAAQGISEGSKNASQSSSTPSQPIELPELNDFITRFNQAIEDMVTQFRRLSEAISPVVDTFNKEKEDNTKPRKYKNAMTADEFEAVRSDIEANAKSLFHSQNMQHMDLVIEQTTTGVAKITANLKEADGQWKKFTATATKSGDIINTKYKEITDVSKLEKQWQDKEDSARETLSINDQLAAIELVRESLGLEDKDKWTISVDDKGFITIRNNLADVNDATVAATQKFKDYEDAVEHFNVVTSRGSVLSLANKGESQTATSSNEDSKKAIGQARLNKEAESMLRWLETNSKASDKFGEQIRKLVAEVKTASSAEAFKDIQEQFSKIRLEATELGLLGKVKGLTVNESSIKKITSEVDTKSLETRLQKIRELYKTYADVNKLGDNSILPGTIDNIKQYEEALTETLNKIKQATADGGQADANDLQKLVNTYNDLTDAVKLAQNELNGLQKALGRVLSEDEKIIASNNMKKWLEINSRATKEYGEDIERLARQMKEAVTEADFKKYMTEFKKFTSLAAADGLTGRSFVGELRDTFSHISQIMGSYNAIDLVQDLGREVVENIKLIDSEMTNLQMATGLTEKQTKSLIDTYGELGDKLSVLGTDLSAGTTSWLKQGESLQDSMQLAQDTMVLAKLGGVEATEAAQYLTSALKGYQMASSEAMDVVDKISQVDIMSATSVSGLAEGMSEVASASRIAGISLDRLLGYLAVIGETTQDSMSSVGSALNTIFARMGAIKLGRLDDYQNETGESLSNVETVLKGEGISLRDASGEFRDFSEVLDETAAKWENLGSVSRNAIAQAFAGKMMLEHTGMYGCWLN